MYNYNKAITGLTLVYLLLFMSFWCVVCIGLGSMTLGTAHGVFRKMDMPGEKIGNETMDETDEISGTDKNADFEIAETSYLSSESEMLDVAASSQRVVDYRTVKKDGYVFRLSEEDMETLCRIVEAEAGSEDEEGRLLVANVVLNRVESALFPDTVTEVVMQHGDGIWQFAPVANGSFYGVEVSETTMNAVERALKGENISDGALFFVARKYADDESMRWFDNNLTLLFAHGGHEFYRY